MPEKRFVLEIKRFQIEDSLKQGDLKCYSNQYFHTIKMLFRFALVNDQYGEPYKAL